MELPHHDFNASAAVPLVNDWIERHRDLRSFLLHLIGIPCTILGVLLMPIYVGLVSLTVFTLALVLFVGGFLVQFLGHGLDGSEPGEIKGLRIWMAKRREARLERRRIGVTMPELDRS